MGDISPQSIPRFQLPLQEHLHEAHISHVYALQLHGDYLVSGSADRTLRIWDIRSQRLIRGPLAGHKGSVLCLRFDDEPEQDVIFSGSTDSTVIIWRFSTGEMLQKLEGVHEESVLSLALDDEYLVTGSKDRSVRVWKRERTNVEPPRTLGSHRAAVNAVQIHRDKAVSGGGDRTIHVWSLENDQLLLTISAHQSGIACLQFNERYILSGSSDKTTRVFDIALEGKEIARMQGHTGIVRSLYALGGSQGELQRIFTGGYDGTVNYWVRTESGMWLIKASFEYGSLQHPPELSSAGATMDSNNTRIFKLQVDGDRLYVAGHSGIIEGWDLSSEM